MEGLKKGYKYKAVTTQRITNTKATTKPIRINIDGLANNPQIFNSTNPLFHEERMEDGRIDDYFNDIEFRVHTTLGHLPPKLHVVACLLAMGYTKAEASRELGIAKSTMSYRVNQIREMYCKKGKYFRTKST